MESLSSISDKEEGELSDDEDSSVQERSIIIDSQDVGRSRRSNVDAAQSRNIKRHRSRSLLRNYRQKRDDPRRYSYGSPARGCGQGHIMCRDFQQKVSERIKSTCILFCNV